MQETPPYSIVEIRILLSQYLDGALQPDRMVELDALMEQFPHYKEELIQLQAARGLVQNSMENALEDPLDEPMLRYNKISDLVWKNIAGQLEADQQVTPGEYDAEFISTYYDGEIAADTPELKAFEAQLYQNPEANRLLAELGQVSDAIRQFGYRQEDNCGIDLTAQVMAAFAAESDTAVDSDILAEETLLNSELEMISAYADQELTPRETIEANRLVESQPQSRLALSHFTRLSEWIQSISQQLQAQAPDVWPQLEPILQKKPEEGGIVVPFDRQKRLKAIAKIAVPAVAAVFVIFLALSGLRMEPAGQSSASENVVNGNELASVPVGSLGRQSIRFSEPQQDGDALDVSAAMNLRASSPRPLKPVLEPSPKIAARSGAAAGEESAVDPNERTPSSEEYLFKALNEQMPEEDISNIIGK